MAHNNVSNKDAMQEFVDWFLRAEAQGPQADGQVWNQVEEFGRRALRQSDRVRRPEGCSPLTWTHAQDVLRHAAHSLVTPKCVYVLGFLPIVVDTMSGAIEKVSAVRDLQVFTENLQVRYDTPVQAYPHWISHDMLQGADPCAIQKLLEDLVHDRMPEGMWDNPEALHCENACVRCVYFPVVYTVNGKLDDEWFQDEVYNPVDGNPEDEDNITQAFFETFTLHGESHTVYEILDVGLSDDVVNEALTARDMREITTRLEMMRDSMIRQENTTYEARIEIQLTWGHTIGDQPSMDDIPAIRIAAVARTMDDVSTARLILGVHTDPREPEVWRDIVAEITTTCFGLGWPNIQIKQFGREAAINQWSEQQTPSYLM